jgi:hypothetical protein
MLLTAPIFILFCRFILGKIWSARNQCQQRAKGGSSRSATQFLFCRHTLLRMKLQPEQGNGSIYMFLYSVCRRDNLWVDYCTFCMVASRRLCIMCVEETTCWLIIAHSACSHLYVSVLCVSKRQPVG